MGKCLYREVCPGRGKRDGAAAGAVGALYIGFWENMDTSTLFNIAVSLVGFCCPSGWRNRGLGGLRKGVWVSC